MTARDLVRRASFVLVTCAVVLALFAIMPNRKPLVVHPRCVNAITTTWSSHDQDGQQITNVRCVP